MKSNVQHECDVALRPPGMVMNLSRMGAAHPTRLSFMRQLVRKLHAENVELKMELWRIDRRGYGEAVYSFELDGFRYGFCAFTSPLNPEDRTDRVIATAWDATFALHDGSICEATLERLRRNVPKQEEGRYRSTELIISRANRSVRMFEHVVDRLSAGMQPDAAMVRRVGYLMRTTAVYGNGKFGLADRRRIAGRKAFAGPFQAELLTVWLIRVFSHDLAEHIARCRNPQAACPLELPCRRALGIGNATGLGMAPFLVGHPALINNWVVAKETALARVRARKSASADEIGMFNSIIGRAVRHVQQLEVEDHIQSRRNGVLGNEIARLELDVQENGILCRNRPWDAVFQASQTLSLEAQELVVSVLLEPNAMLVDDLGNEMSCDREFEINPSMTVSEMRRRFRNHCEWALAHDFTKPESDEVFWYYSEEKLEPRIGNRHREPGADRELTLDIAWQFQQLGRALEGANDGFTAAEFLLEHPELRHAVRRVQNAPDHPYAEIRGNLIGSAMRPIDILRYKLAFFGATKFDPKSDLWTRITMFQGAPVAADISNHDADDWSFPVLTRQ